MANDNNIKKFTAADIEKYHNGQLSAKEMHDLEKAALDDPFLADALEGYSAQGVNFSADIAALKKRLADKTGQAKVIPLPAGGRSSFSWLRAAVLIVLIGGVGVLAYQFLFKTGENQITQLSKREKANAQDTVNRSSQIINKDSSPEYKTGTLNDKLTPDPKVGDQKGIHRDANENNKEVKDSLAINSGIAGTQVPSAPVKAAEDDKVIKSLRNDNAWDRSAAEKNKALAFKKTDDPVKQRNEVADSKTDGALKGETRNVTAYKPVFKDSAGVADGYNYYSKAIEPKSSANGIAANKRNESLYRTTNIFRGRVTDASNNALPFANITNRQDNVGTYSDVQGNFAMVSTDTVLNVQVRSLGFENNNVQLRGRTGNNLITMQEDRSLNASVLDTAKRNISRARNTTMTLEEPEPEDGWHAYSSYVLNNLNIPATFDMKKSGETADNTVEVSFEVNKNGEPINIKIEKSLCDRCDIEAIRLIKDGPKWKRKAKKGKRTTITVPFVKP